MNQSAPTRTLPEQPDLDQLRRQAEELLSAFLRGEPAAAAEVNEHYHGAGPSTLVLHDAQLVLARAYGFESWPKLEAHVDGVTLQRLCDAVNRQDLERAGAMLKVRPELAKLTLPSGHTALHYAVFKRSSEMVRLLLDHGADPNKGIWPHSEATTPFVMAKERGYEDIAQLIREEERRRPGAEAVHDPDAWPPEMAAAAKAGDQRAVIAFLEKHPEYINVPHYFMAPLHGAAVLAEMELLTWLLDHGADPNLRDRGGPTPLELVGYLKRDPQLTPRIAAALISRGAKMTARAAVIQGNVEWIRARHAEGKLENPLDQEGGLLSLAVQQRRREIVELLLDLGFDPNERLRVGGVEKPVYTWSAPLRVCVRQNDLDLARLLLDRGGDPNGQNSYYGSPTYMAYLDKNQPMIDLLESRGGYLNAAEAGYAGQTEIARKMLAGELEPHFEEAQYGGTNTLEQLLACGANSGTPAIVRMALERIDWPRGDARWYWPLTNALPPNEPWSDDVRDRYHECFRLILERSGPDLRGGQGQTILHEVIASRSQPAVAAMLLDAGARTGLRDDLLESTPLGWACRWGRTQIARLLLERGADPVEPDAESWATPQAWAQKCKNEEILALLREHSRTGAGR